MTQKKGVLVFGTQNLYYEANEEAQGMCYTVTKYSGYLKTLEKGENDNNYVLHWKHGT